MATAELTSQDEWISVPAAMQILGATRVIVNRLIESGEVTVRQVPHGRPSLLRADVESIASNAIKPRRATA